MTYNKELLLIALVAFTVGLLVGLVVAKHDGSATSSNKSVAVKAVVTRSADQSLEIVDKLKAAEPDDFRALVRRAHEHFDANRPVEAVEAYKQALALHPDDADLLTDQGVMYRRLGWFDKAIENFSRAADIDAAHLQSLYNLGIVYRYDLHQPQQAVAAWQRYLAREPHGESAAEVRAEIASLSTETVKNTSHQ